MPHIIGDLDDLVTSIEHVARGRSQSQQTEARQQAEKILAEARERAGRIRQESFDRAQVQAEAERRRLAADATVTARRTYLSAREELFDHVWQQAEERLRTRLDDSDFYAEVLGRLAQSAARMIDAGHLILAADPKGHELLTEARLEAWAEAASEARESSVTFERAAEPLDSWGGLRVSEAEGRRQVDATFSTRLALARDQIREEIFKQLVQET